MLFNLIEFQNKLNDQCFQFNTTKLSSDVICNSNLQIIDIEGKIYILDNGKLVCFFFCFNNNLLF